MNNDSASKHDEPLINPTPPNESAAPVSREGEWTVSEHPERDDRWTCRFGSLTIVATESDVEHYRKIAGAHNASLFSGTEGQREEILQPSFCNVAGHFKFQQNGNSCLMCQREWRLMRAAWETGIKVARSYGDNIVHLEGVQKERQWRAANAAILRAELATELPEQEATIGLEVTPSQENKGSGTSTANVKAEEESL